MNEAQHTEWKESWRDEYLKWVCAFANTEGGVLFIGKTDDGLVKDVANAGKLLEDLPAKIKNHLGIVCEVKLREEGVKKYLSILVQAYSNPISYKGKYYIRSGSSTHALNGVELTEFLLKKSGQTWDAITAEDASIIDIDGESIRDFITSSKSKNRLPQTDGLSDLEILQKLRLADDEKIKRAGLVLFGKDPNRFFANCKVMIGRFGSDSEELIAHEPLEGNLIYLLDQTQELLNYKFLNRAVDFEGLHRKEEDEYPAAALREALLNALVHKKYMGAAIQIRVFENKLSVWNEGSLPEGLSIDNLKEEHNSKPPNPLIADACFKAGYIDTWGRGTLKIYKACAEADLPEPQIIEKNGGIEVTLFKAAPSEKSLNNFRETSEKLTYNRDENLELLSNNYGNFISFLQSEHSISSEKLRRNFGETSEEFRNKFGDRKALLIFIIALKSKISAREASKMLNVSDRTVETYLSELKENIIKRVGPDKGGYWKINKPLES